MKIVRKKFPNGLRLIMVPMKESPTVTALVMVETGSKYETKKENGLSHFLEHMCFKGTKKRPRSIDISHELDALGAENNAFTSYEYTGYYAKAHPKHIGTILDVVADIYLNPQFPGIELEKEKGVILEEMNMYEDLPQRKVQEIFTELLYGDQPAGWTVLGRKEVIKNAKTKDFINYRKKHYTAQATVVVIAGDFDPADIIRKVSALFKAIPITPKSPKKKVVEKQSKPQIKIQFKKTDQAHLVLGFRTFPVSDQRSAALHVLSAVLGSGMSSRLFQKIREELGVAYYVRSGIDELTDHGFFTISTGIDTRRVDEVVKEILNLCKDLKVNKVPEVELQKSKESLLGGLAMGLESSDAVATFVADQEILRRKIEVPAEIEKKIRRITADDVLKLANQIFTDKNLNLAIVGNIKSGDKLQRILKIDTE